MATQPISLRRFEALGLLPDTEMISGYVKGIYAKPDGTPQFLKTEVPMQRVVDGLPDGASYTLKKLERKWVISVITLIGGKMRRAYVKPDSKKVQAFNKRRKKTAA